MTETRSDSRPTTLDALDRKIIDALQQDGRRPYTTVARDLGVSEATIRKRVSRLQRKGVLQIVAAVDALTLGYVRAEVGIRVLGPSISKVTKRLEAVPEVSYIELVLGSFDISITVNCTDNDHLLAVLGDDIRSIPGVEVVEAWTVLKVTKDIYHWAPPE
jgi:Lrp/AsnC family transcriptional regulator for asnA, asnC and gidA